MHPGSLPLENYNPILLLDAMWSGKAAGIGALRKVARAEGPVSPVGIGNTKTRSAGTYRRVGLASLGQGGTCPPCRYAGNGCYAEHGKPAMQAKRALGGEADLRAVAIALSWAAKRGRLARIGVTGDLAGPDGRVDERIVRNLLVMCRRMQRLTGRSMVAWGYTHLPYGPWVDALRGAGLMIRLSDRSVRDHGIPGAIVVENETDAKEQGAFVCPVQTGRTESCASCGACWNSRKDVAFLAHGVGRKRVVRIIQKKLVTK
jgi:hypothetical protein